LTWHSDQRKNVPDFSAQNEDEDVKREIAKVCNPDIMSKSAVQIMHLRKEFPEKLSVKDLTLSLEDGELFALLGQNGAGKTTTMNMLAGLGLSTSGDALIHGYSIRSQMGSIRNNMGVCPQHDLLFNELTARQHIHLFSGLKGVPQTEWTKLAEERLHAVRLLAVADDKVDTYSGGMKRRLSVMLATIGDPKVCYLDEVFICNV
jgi:ABC-type multidrug transport system ATPase subunit